MAVRIVLVDDHRILRDGLRLRLQHEADFVLVGEAATAEEAYACLRQNPADVVIMDLNLPGDNGLVATTRLHAAWPALKIIVLTGETAAGAPQDAMLAGASGFLRKEDAAEELVRAVRTVVDGKTYLSPDAATAITQALLTKSAGTTPGGLSERELAVLRGLATGQSYKEIASDLGVSAKSIETYRARLVRKTGCSSRADLVRYAIRQGLVKA